MFKGSMVALVTPFKNNTIDFTSLRNLLDIHIKSGTTALVIAGTTGEGGTLTYAELTSLIKHVVHYVSGAVPVIAGTAANSTATCIELATKAMEYGADGVLIMTPAYIKPTQEGLWQHYTAIAKAVPLPIILYNVPARTASDLLPTTVARLAKHANIIGIKDATGDINRLNQLLQLCEDNIDIYSGDDATAAEWILKGAKGVISVTANVVPKLMANMCNAALNLQKNEALQLQTTLMPLHDALFLETNPIPVKWALHYMELISDEIRLPLTNLTINNQNILRIALGNFTPVSNHT